MSKKDITNALRSLVSDVSALRVEVTEHYSAIGSALTRLSVLIARGAALETDRGGDWKEWAVTQCHGFGRDGADLAPPTVYRLRNAGAVALVLGDEIGGASYLALVPLYRFLASASNEEEEKAAHEVIRALWAQGQKASRTGTPTAEAVLALAEKKNGGTRGSAGKTAEERKAAQKKKNERSRNTPTETTEEKDTETDPGARDACRAAVVRFLKDTDVDTAVVTLGVMLGAVKLAETHTVSVADAILREVLKEKKAAQKKAAA